MKVIGLIGGMSWESSAVYYRLLNERVGDLLGASHSCECIMDSVDFAYIERLQHDGKWKELCHIMKDKALKLEKAGAEIILLCTNTMHVCTPEMTRDLKVPFLHIADATGKAIVSKGLSRVGLLGTRFTMEKDFYSKILKEKYKVEVIIPKAEDREIIHSCIYKELVRGEFSPVSKREFQRIIADLQKKGAEGVILGCTEIPMLIQQSDVDIPVFDTTSLHVDAALEGALN
ncbi:MAG: aspartate/glutamate racemase family protein [Lutimonas sp.]